MFSLMPRLKSWQPITEAVGAVAPLLALLPPSVQISTQLSRVAPNTTPPQTMYMLPARRLALAPRGLSGTPFGLRGRYSSSSSKPSSPSDRPRNLTTPSSSTKRKAGISGVEGEALAGGQGEFSKLPAVPNTDHLHPAGMYRWSRRWLVLSGVGYLIYSRQAEKRPLD